MLGSPQALVLQAGQALEGLPGAAQLHPSGMVTELHVVLTPARIVVRVACPGWRPLLPPPPLPPPPPLLVRPFCDSSRALPSLPLQLLGRSAGEEPLVDFVAPVYRDARSGTLALFGPTLRLRAGGTATIRLANNLTQPAALAPGAGDAPLNGFSHSADTNLHAHGLHVDPGGAGSTQLAGCVQWPLPFHPTPPHPTAASHAAGVAGQAQAGRYSGSDNIFAVLGGKAAAANAPREMAYSVQLPATHLPGLAWQVGAAGQRHLLVLLLVPPLLLCSRCACVSYACVLEGICR